MRSSPGQRACPREGGGRARRHPGGRRRAEAAAAVRAHSTMTMNAGDHRAKRRQFDVIIRMKAGLICRAQRVLAMRAVLRHAVDDPIRVAGERPEHPRTALSLFRRAALGAVGFAPLRWRHRGVIRGLGRPAQPRLEFGNPPGQFLDLGGLRQPQAISSSLDSLASSSLYILRLNQRNPLLSS